MTLLSTFFDLKVDDFSRFVLKEIQEMFVTSLREWTVYSKEREPPFMAGGVGNRDSFPPRGSPKEACETVHSLWEVSDSLRTPRLVRAGGSGNSSAAVPYLLSTV